MSIDVGHGCRTASTVGREKGETCKFCRHSKVRESSGRLECPFQGNYQVGKNSTCNRWKGLA